MIQCGRLCGLELKPLLIAGPIDRHNLQNAAIRCGGLAGRQGQVSLHQAEACGRIDLLAIHVCADHDATASKLLAEIQVKVAVARPARLARILPSRRPARHGIPSPGAGSLRPCRADRRTQQLSSRSASHYAYSGAHQREGHRQQAPVRSSPASVRPPGSRRSGVSNPPEHPLDISGFFTFLHRPILAQHHDNLGSRGVCYGCNMAIVTNDHNGIGS